MIKFERRYISTLVYLPNNYHQHSVPPHILHPEQITKPSITGFHIYFFRILHEDIIKVSSIDSSNFLKCFQCISMSTSALKPWYGLRDQSKEDDVTSYLSTRFVPVSTQGWNDENCSHRWKIDPVRKVRGQQRNQDWCWWVAHHQTHERNGSVGDTTILNHCQHSWWSRSRYWRLTNKIWKMRNCVVTTANEESFKSKTFQKMDKLQEFQIFLLIWLTDLPQDWD